MSFQLPWISCSLISAMRRKRSSGSLTALLDLRTLQVTAELRRAKWDFSNKIGTADSKSFWNFQNKRPPSHVWFAPLTNSLQKANLLNFQFFKNFNCTQSKDFVQCVSDMQESFPGTVSC